VATFIDIPKTRFEVCRISEVVAQYLKTSDPEVRSKVGKSGVVGVLKVK
jgi:metal-dependent amidase/aminoacylase/carboxypeptidase family protein